MDISSEELNKLEALAAACTDSEESSSSSSEEEEEDVVNPGGYFLSLL